MSLNQGQLAAAEGFFEFLLATDQNEFIISGAGGVGKTYLMSHLIDEVMPRYFKTCELLGIKPIYHEVVMTATTNKAADVLAKATKRPTQTIHSLLRLKVTENFSTGEVFLRRMDPELIIKDTIIFIDECSMIDRALDKHLKESTFNCKIIYVGDHNQLAPIKEPISPIYRRTIPFFELTEPMRNAHQPILLQLCNQLRETVDTGVFKPIQLTPGVVDQLPGSLMEAEIEKYFLNNDNQNRILAYTNTRVIEYNEHVRHIKGLPAHLTKGEHVINNAPFSVGRLSIPAETSFVVQGDSAPKTTHYIDGSTQLEVFNYTLKSVYGNTLSVDAPVDRDYYSKLLKYYAKTKDWVPYFKLKEYADLRSRDASTIHKAQGSTYDTVFIDLDDLNRCRNPAVASRLLYVAFSRAKERIVLYGDLAQRFGGLLTAP